MTEVWRDILDFPGYAVSDKGRIKRTTHGRKTYPGKILKDQRTGSGYRSVALTRDGKAIRQYVHRLVAMAFIGEIPDGHEVNHMDGDKANNALRNLEYVTRSQNNDHAVLIGVFPTGERHHWWKGGPKVRQRKPPHKGDRHWTKVKPHRVARGDSCGHNKLTSDQVAAIRASVLNGEMQKDLASRYGVSRAQICRVVKGRHWK